MKISANTTNMLKLGQVYTQKGFVPTIKIVGINKDNTYVKLTMSTSSWEEVWSTKIIKEKIHQKELMQREPIQVKCKTCLFFKRNKFVTKCDRSQIHVTEDDSCPTWIEKKVNGSPRITKLLGIINKLKRYEDN